MMKLHPPGRSMGNPSYLHPTAILSPISTLISQIFIASRLPAARCRRSLHPKAPSRFPSPSPDGRWIAYYGVEGSGDWWRNNNLWVTPLDGSSPAKNLTKEYDLNVSEGVMNDTNAGAAALSPPIWAADSQTLYFPVGQHGSSRLHSINLDGQNLQAITPEIGAVGLFGFDKSVQKLAYFYSTMTDPGQIWAQDLGSGTSPIPLTATNVWLKDVDLGTVEEIWFEGRDANRLQGLGAVSPRVRPIHKNTHPS